MKTAQPVVKEKWGIGVLFLSVAALCYILGQLGFISWVPEYAKSLGMSLGDAGKLVSDFWMSYMIGMWSFQLHPALLRPAAYLNRPRRARDGADVPVYQWFVGAYAVVYSDPGLLLQRHLHPRSLRLGSQQTRVASPKLVNFILTCGTIGTMLTFVVTGPIVAASGPLAALHTANGLYAVVFVMCFILGFVSRHRQNNAQAASH